MFNLESIQTNSNFDVVPAGKYSAYVTDSNLADTKSGGQMIKVTFTIAGGDFDKRKVFTNFNVKNSNEKAVEIGMQQLKSLLEASGFANPNKLESVEQLQGLRVGIKTKVRQSEQYGDQAEVQWFYKIDDKADVAGGLDSETIPF